jgi:hypothetical protein
VWTYSLTQLSTSKMMQVRRIIGDTDTTDQLLQDEEITFALSQRPSIYGAAAEACRYIAGQFARLVDTAASDLKVAYSQRSKQYTQLAILMEAKALARSGGLPYAGGISISDKETREQDPDRVQPQFQLDMEDNFTPVGPVNSET